MVVAQTRCRNIAKSQELAKEIPRPSTLGIESGHKYGCPNAGQQRRRRPPPPTLLPGIVSAARAADLPADRVYDHRSVGQRCQAHKGGNIRNASGRLSPVQLREWPNSSRPVFVHLAKVRTMLKSPRRKAPHQMDTPVAARAQSANFLQLSSKKCTTLAGP